MRCDKKDLLLYAVTDRAWLGDKTLAWQVEESLKGGATMIQLREKHLDEDTFHEEALELQDAWNNPDISLHLSEDHLALELEESAQLAVEISVSPDGAVTPNVTWATSDEDVATVDTEGTVTAVGEGKAEITASCGAVTASCEITVVAPAES